MNPSPAEAKPEPGPVRRGPTLHISVTASPVEIAAVLAVLGQVAAGRRGIDKTAGASGPRSLWPGSVGPLSVSRRRVWRDPAAAFEDT